MWHGSRADVDTWWRRTAAYCDFGSVLSRIIDTGFGHANLNARAWRTFWRHSDGHDRHSYRYGDPGERWLVAYCSYLHTEADSRANRCSLSSGRW